MSPQVHIAGEQVLVQENVAVGVIVKGYFNVYVLGYEKGVERVLSRWIFVYRWVRDIGKRGVKVS